MWKQLCLMVCVLIVCCASVKGNDSIVQTAENLAKESTYKRNPSPKDRTAKKYDCTTFVQEVLSLEGYSVKGATGNRINITDVTSAQMKPLVEQRDTKIKGVVTALVESSQGTEVSGLAKLRPGDVIQMWKISGQNVSGHTGVVKSVDVGGSKVTLVGAHNTKDGCGTKKFKLGSTGYATWFAVRPSK